MVASTPKPERFISCDWGSSSFRLRLVARNTRVVIAEKFLPMGIKQFAAMASEPRAEAMERFLGEQLESDEPFAANFPLLISGMVGSTVGWHELPYAYTPFPLDGSACRLETLTFSLPSGARREATLVSGLRSDDDVMRGEECALLGACALHPELARKDRFLAILAGTHPKHAVIQQGVATSFRTHLTGELFEVLGRHSLLSSSLTLATAGDQPDLEPFRAGVACAWREGLSGALFQVRVRDVLHHVEKSKNFWFLSGVLVGGELRDSAFQVIDGLVLIGDANRIRLYREAFREIGLEAQLPPPLSLDLGEAVVAGHDRLLQRLVSPSSS